MATGTQFDFGTTDLRALAAHRFPLSGAAGNIRGEGRFVAVTKCSKRWRVYCYATPEDRDQKLQEWSVKNCPSGIDCCGDHESVDL